MHPVQAERDRGIGRRVRGQLTTNNEPDDVNEYVDDVLAGDHEQ